MCLILQPCVVDLHFIYFSTKTTKCTNKSIFSRARSQGRKKRGKHTRGIQGEQFFFTNYLNSDKMFRQLFAVAFIRPGRRFQHKSVNINNWTSLGDLATKLHTLPDYSYGSVMISL
jgi:hypothetical protein